MLDSSEQSVRKVGIMRKVDEIVEDIQKDLAECRRQLILAIDDEREDLQAYWQQEVSMLAKELVAAQIERPFTAYENEYGDYPI